MKTAALKKNGVTLIETVEVANRFRERMRGLLGRPSLGTSRAMYLNPCSCIHTFFMKFTIDLVFLDRDMKVEKIVTKIPPGRVISGGMKARSVLEMESGWFPEGDLKVGDEVFMCPHRIL